MILISVIIPAYNAEKTIASALEALLNQKYPRKKYEVIVVDDGSKDNTYKVAKEFPVKVYKIKHKGPAYARNFGAKKAKGNIIFFTDADCVPDKHWIKNMVEPFKNPEIVGVSGTYRTLNSNKFAARFCGYEIEHRHRSMKKQRFIDFIGTFSAGYRKNIFFKFKGFDERFKKAQGEDPELSFRISKAGLKMLFQPKAFVYHPHPDRLWKYLKQKYQRAMWRNLLYWPAHRKKLLADSYTAKSLFPQIFIPSLSFLIVFMIFLPSLFLGLLLYNILKFYVIPLILIFFFVALFLNFDLISFIWKKEKLMAIVSPFILAVRNFVVVFAIIEGIFRYLLKKF